MAYSGLGAGTIGDPYQITTLTEFRQINRSAIGVPQFTGTGLNDFSSDIINYATGGGNHTLIGSHTFTITITKSGSIASIATYYSGGTGYQAGDTFYIDGGTPGDLARGSIYNAVGGSLYGFDLTYAGSGYTTTGSHTVTNIIGTGTGGHVNLTAIAADQFKWKKDAGAETLNVFFAGTLQLLSDGISIKLNMTKGHTIGDVWVIPIEPVKYFKLMNDLDWNGLSTYGLAYAIYNFQGHLDGNSKSMLNMTVGGNFCFGAELKNGCLIKDLTFRITNSINNNEDNKERILFWKGNSALANVSLTGIKVITSGSGQLWWFADYDFASSCTLRDIVLEGNIQGVFTYIIRGVLESCKVLKTTNMVPYTMTPIVSFLKGEMKYCQLIALRIQSTGVYKDRSLLAETLGAGGKITESFAYGFFTVTFANPATTLVAHALVSYSLSTGADATEIKDSYFKGSFSVNGGEVTTTTSNDYGKSGYGIVGGAKSPLVTRCIVNADIVSPLNNNRTVLSKAGLTRTTKSYYNATVLTSITPVDEVNRQVGLTAAQFLVASNFDTFDFVNTWIIGGSGPELRNNPLYSFETSIVSCQVTGTTRLTSTTFSIDLAVQFASNFGVEVYQNGLLIDTKANLLSSIITVVEADLLYLLRPFYMNGAIKTYTTDVNYQHYVYAMAIQTPTNVAITNIVTLNTPIPAHYVHGSTLYNGYIYGVTRNKPFADTHGVIVRAPEHNLNAYTTMAIKTGNYTDAEYIAVGGFSDNMEQIVECGGYLYFCFSSTLPYSEIYLCQFDPSVNDYKVFRLPIGPRGGDSPIITDGEYLYFGSSAANSTYKIKASKFVGGDTKFNIDSYTPVTIDAVYDSSSQGGHIAGGYSPSLKGAVHSGLCDAEYIYLSFTTNRGSLSGGYDSVLGISVFEAHKVKKSDMTAAGWVKIPQSTDDMTQTKTHLFYGIEFSGSVNAAAYGYGWGSYAIRKIDMKITGLPPLSSLDLSPITASYGVLICGNYLLDMKTNLITYILDISDVDNWSVTEPIAKRTLKVFKYNALGLPMNEFLLSTDNTLYSFLFSAPSLLAEFQLPDINLYAIPTIEALDALLDGNSNIFSGFLLSTGGKLITSRGFHYGITSGELINTIISTEITPAFHAVFPVSVAGTYYYQAFAVNSEGEGLGEVKSISIIGGVIYLGDQRVQKIYLGSTLIRKV